MDKKAKNLIAFFVKIFMLEIIYLLSFWKYDDNSDYLMIF